MEKLKEALAIIAVPAIVFAMAAASFLFFKMEYANGTSVLTAILGVFN